MTPIIAYAHIHYKKVKDIKYPKLYLCSLYSIYKLHKKLFLCSVYTMYAMWLLHQSFNTRHRAMRAIGTPCYETYCFDR